MEDDSEGEHVAGFGVGLVLVITFDLKHFWGDVAGSSASGVEIFGLRGVLG